jgi:hypothetical protein
MVAPRPEGRARRGVGMAMAASRPGDPEAATGRLGDEGSGRSEGHGALTTIVPFMFWGWNEHW